MYSMKKKLYENLKRVCANPIPWCGSWCCICQGVNQILCLCVREGKQSINKAPIVPRFVIRRGAICSSVQLYPGEMLKFSST